MLQTWFTSLEASFASFRARLNAPTPHAAFLIIAAVCGFFLFVDTYVAPIMPALAVQSPDFQPGCLPSLHGLITLITYQFGHANWAHYFGNFFIAAPFSLYLEPRIGSRRFVFLWLTAGVGSALMFIFIPQLFPWEGLIGASGSISGVIAVALLHITATHLDRRLAFLALAAFVGFFFPELCRAVMSSLIPDGIGHWGHIGGALTGLIYLSSHQTGR